VFARLANTELPELGLVVEETAVSQADAPITINGYVMYWVSAEERAELKALAEAELAAYYGRSVTVALDGHDVYMHAGESYFTYSAGLALVFVTLMVGISFIPSLMMEEKKNKTLEVLRVSPASAGHLVAGKAVTGMFYGLLGCLMVLIVFGHLVLQWGLAVMAALLGTFFMAAVGLLLGSYVENRAQLQMVAWLVAVPLLLPVILIILEGLVPTGVMAVLRWAPTAAVAKLFRLSFTLDATLSHYAADTAVSIALTFGLLAAVVWIVRRQDRE
jgi:ABC-type Na+ efflux pump permease subunit